MKIDVNAAWVALICAAVFFWALFSEEPQSVATTPTPTMDKVRGEFDKQLDSILAQVKANNSQLQELRDEVREALKANSGGEVIDPPPAPVVRVTCDNPDCPCENCTCEDCDCSKEVAAESDSAIAGRAILSRYRGKPYYFRNSRGQSSKALLIDHLTTHGMSREGLESFTWQELRKIHGALHTEEQARKQYAKKTPSTWIPKANPVPSGWVKDCRNGRCVLRRVR